MKFLPFIIFGIAFIALVVWLVVKGFLVGGWEECFDVDTDHVRPVIWRFDVHRERAQTFHGPPVPRTHLATMERALRAQWQRQFPWLQWE